VARPLASPSASSPLRDIAGDARSSAAQLRNDTSRGLTTVVPWSNVPVLLVLSCGMDEPVDLDFVGALAAHLPRLQRTVRLLTADADAAEDVVAEAIARAWPHWRAGRIADPAAYVRRVAVNLALRRWRRLTLSRRRDHAALDWPQQARDGAVDVVERDRTLRAVMRLPPRRRAVIVLRFYDDLVEQQIADTLGISVGTVKSQLSRALEQLRVDLGALEE
jgi:RNA polymerase sigma-70 factor (sigma-E family)